MWDRDNGVLFGYQKELTFVIHRKKIDETRVVQHSQAKSNIRRQKSILSPHLGLAGLEVRERRGGLAVCAHIEGPPQSWCVQFVVVISHVPVFASVYGGGCTHVFFPVET